MSLQGKNVLVTGGAGFIGSHLAERLIKEKASVSIIKEKASDTLSVDSFKEKLKMYDCDLKDYGSVKKVLRTVQPDIIFHLASFTSPERDVNFSFVVKNNFFGTVNLIKALRGKFELFINTGTCEEYGNGPVPFDEEQLPISVSPYSLSKIITTYYCGMLHATYNLPVITLRPFLTYGPRQRNSRMLIPSSILNSLKNEPLKMTKGEQTRDFIHVNDVVEGYILTAKSKKAIGEVINIGSGKEYKIKDIVQKIYGLVGSKAKPLIGALPYRTGETMHFYCSNKKAKKILGWSPTISLEDGLKETVDWYKEKFDSGEIKKWMGTN